MAKQKEPVITVRTVFVGKRTERQAFIDLILEKEKTRVDMDPVPRYNIGNQNHGVHGGLEKNHA